MGLASFIWNVDLNSLCKGIKDENETKDDTETRYAIVWVRSFPPTDKASHFVFMKFRELHEATLLHIFGVYLLLR